MQQHTLILLSRQGTQAVVTCFRGAFLGFSGSGSGDMLRYAVPASVLFFLCLFRFLWRDFDYEMIKRGGGGSGLCALEDAVAA